MRLRILKGFHYPLKLVPSFVRNIGISKVGKTNTMTRKITFNDDAKYHIDGVDQWDWSKLFGVFFGLFGIHRQSLRFGWRYNPTTDKIEISRLMYFDGGHTHTMDKLTEIDTNEEHTYTLSHTFHDYCVEVSLKIDDTVYLTVIPRPTVRLRFGTGFYFGGNQRAPQTVSVTTDRGI